MDIFNNECIGCLCYVQCISGVRWKCNILSVVQLGLQCVGTIYLYHLLVDKYLLDVYYKICNKNKNCSKA